MNTPMLTLPVSRLIPGSLKKKRVLLVDGSPKKRDLRAEIMRKLGIDVDCAADISEARSWWRADLYNLVLINVENEMGHRDRFCDDMRSATPPQQLAFFVGKPEYLANSPIADGVLTLGEEDDPAAPEEVKATPFAGAGGLTRWGIMEASQRISAVRSSSAARTKAMRDRPEPPRDLEMQRAKRSNDSRTLDELLREELIREEMQ